MKSVRDPALRVLRRGVVTGVLAGAAAGVLDALWAWRSAAQFLPGVLGRARFVLFCAAEYALAGAAAGLVLSLGLLVLSRASRLGDLVRFAHATHVQVRARDPREALIGLSLALVTLPVVGIALAVAFRLTGRFIAGRKAPELSLAVAMGAGLAAVAVAVPISLVIARGVEVVLARIARRVPSLASPFAPLVAAAVLLGLGGALWAARNWETARVLPLRPPAVVLIGLALAPVMWRAAIVIEALLSLLPAIARRATWVLAAPVLAVMIILLGGPPSISNSATSYTALGGPIARSLRLLADWDRDGYARILGGGDCDDGDPTVHPGAPEIPDDGIDQNCVGGDPTTAPLAHDVGFVPRPASIPADANILVITVDTLRADHLGAYGYGKPTSPRLDELARGGTVFEASWAHAPSTRYSIPAILTGRYPLDVYYDYTVDGWPGLLPRATTFGEALQALGYLTGAITNYWYFDRARHMDQGFAEYDNQNASRHASVSGAGPEQTKGSSSQQQTDKAIAFVERHAGQKWALWVHYYDPHYAYEPHPEVPSLGGDRIGLYDGEIRFTDLHIGRLLDDLRAKGLYEKTVIVVTGDHGEGFGEHDIDLHGYHLYAAQTRVPLIVRVPGLAAQRSSFPVGHVDILPTLVNLAGGVPHVDMQGRSLVSALAGSPPAGERVVFQQLAYEGNHQMRGGATAACHVIYNVSPDASWEVYRVGTDPEEKHDVAGDDDACPSVRRAVERRYDEEQVPPGAAAALLTAKPPVATPLDVTFRVGPAQVKLLGVDLPATAAPGDTVPVTWTFEATGPLPGGWKMFVHAQAPGRPVINADHRPARPFEWWRKGQYIRYTTDVTLPRTIGVGTLVINAGLFKGNDRAVATSSVPGVKIEGNAVQVGALPIAARAVTP